MLKICQIEKKVVPLHAELSIWSLELLLKQLIR